MRGCSGTDEYEPRLGGKKSQYTHYKKLDYTTVLDTMSLCAVCLCFQDLIFENTCNTYNTARITLTLHCEPCVGRFS